jgi:hypothetical protein
MNPKSIAFLDRGIPVNDCRPRQARGCLDVLFRGPAYRRSSLLALLLLAACADPTVPSVRDTSGTVIGSSERKTVPEAESQIAVDPAVFVVRSRFRRDLSDRLEETIEGAPGGGFGTGYARWERFHLAGGFSQNANNYDTIVRHLGGSFYTDRSFPSTIRTADMVTGRNRYGAYQYAIVEGRDDRCAIGSQYELVPGNRTGR